MNKTPRLSRVANIKQAEYISPLIRDGELVYDIETGFCYCKGIDRYSIVVEPELAPCLGKSCDKRKYCYKYKLACKFSEDKFILRDLSEELYVVKNYFGEPEKLMPYCCRDNRYRCFRWDEI